MDDFSVKNGDFRAILNYQGVILMIIPLVGVGDAPHLKRWNMSTTVNQPFHGYPATPGCSQRESIRMVDFMQLSHILWRLLSQTGRPFAAHTTAPPYHKTVPLCRTHHTVPQTVRTKRTMYGTMVPHGTP